MIDSIKKYISEADSIAVLCHINSDGDAVGSALGLTELLVKLGKKADCIMEEVPESRLAFLGDNYIIYNGENKEYDLCIAVDTASKERLGKRERIFDSADRTIVIDHHKTNPGYGDINCIKGDYSAAAEVIAELAELCGYELNDRIAMLLYSGIMSDSGCLRYSSVKPDTVRRVAGLMEYSFDHAEVSRLLFDSFPLGIIKLRGAVMNNIESYCEGKISLIVTDSEMIKSYGVSDTDAGNLVDIPRMVEKTEIGIEIKERNGIIRGSLRSNGDAEVDRIAAVFGGGGHMRAAGVTMNNMTLEEAKQALLTEAEKELCRIGK